MIFDIDSVENKIGYVFKDKMLLRQCFTHASYANEHGQPDNELLEFFGDSIMEFVVTEYLYKNASGDEGTLTQKRAQIVSKKPLLTAINNLGLNKFVLLGNGMQNSANQDEKLFSSIYETIVAGIYLDGGLAPAKKFIIKTIINDFENARKKQKSANDKVDYKSQLQEFVQKHQIGSITYETLWKKGPDHNPEFKVAVLLNGSRIAEGKGTSKKNAQSRSAQLALNKIKKQAVKKVEFRKS